MEHPFDARKVRLAEDHRPPTAWRPVSLISALREAMLQGGEGASNGDRTRPSLRPIVDELTSRGFDGDSLVRYGFFPEISVPIISCLFSRRFPNFDVRSSADIDYLEPDGLPRDRNIDSNGWGEILTPAIELMYPAIDWSEPTSENAFALVATSATLVFPWVMSASLNDILSLTPPSADYLESILDTTPPDVSLAREYRWIVERFSVTRLSEWTTPSLHLEHQWRTENHPAPCSEELMRDRTVDLNELNGEIARRATSEQPNRTDPQLAAIGSTLARKMQQRAVRLLQAGRYREAATLFEFAVDEDPNDAVAVNNLGFCLIPQHPTNALGYLQRAHELGYAPQSINLYNRALCHMVTGEPRITLSLIRELWPDVADEAASLWVLGESGMKLRTEANCKVELARLAKIASDASNDPSATQWAQIWSELDTLREPDQ